MAVLAFVSGPLALIAALVLTALFMMYQGKFTGFVVTFTVDCRHDRPRWQSDDEDFWPDGRTNFKSGAAQCSITLPTDYRPLPPEYRISRHFFAPR